jgi:hypothetical protein
LIALSHDNLENWFNTNFQLHHVHGFSLDEIHNMIPWEREIYIVMLNQHLDMIEELRKQNTKKRF